MTDRGIPELPGLWALKEKGLISEAEYTRLAALLREQAEQSAAEMSGGEGSGDWHMPEDVERDAERSEQTDHHQRVGLGRAAAMGCLAVFGIRRPRP